MVMVFYLIHKRDCVNKVLSCYYAKFYTFIFDGTPILLTNKIISTISTISTIQNHFDYPKSFRLSKIISTFNFDHRPKVEIFRLLDFNFDFKYSNKCNSTRYSSKY